MIQSLSGQCISMNVVTSKHLLHHSEKDYYQFSIKQYHSNQIGCHAVFSMGNSTSLEVISDSQRTPHLACNAFTTTRSSALAFKSNWLTANTTMKDDKIKWAFRWQNFLEELPQGTFRTLWNQHRIKNYNLKTEQHCFWRLAY